MDGFGIRIPAKRCYNFTTEAQLYADVAAGNITAYEAKVILRFRNELKGLTRTIDVPFRHGALDAYTPDDPYSCGCEY